MNIVVCPGCLRAQPHSTFTGEIEMPWKCLACAEIVCVWCYHVHTAKWHRDLNVKR